MKKQFDEIPEVKDRIFSAARSLFISKGYKGTSIREIAAASGTNVAMVNYYFRSKYDLFEDIFEEALDHLWKKIFSTLSSDKEFFELVKEWINAYYDVLLEYPELPIFLLNEVTIAPERLTERFKNHEPYKVFLRISTRIEFEKAKGTIRDTPPLDFLLNVVSMSLFPFIFRNLARPLAGVTEEQYDEMLKEHKSYVAQFVINAIKK